MTTPAIVLSGCGAVAEEYYVPALVARSDRLRVIGLHDRDPARTAAIGHAFPHAVATTSLDALLGLGADLAIIASPPAVHAEQTIAALERGLDVLCEKPMALGLEDAAAMAEAARVSGRLLAVGMVRRQFPSSRIARQLIAGNSLGNVLSVTAYEGGSFRWPIRDQSYFSRAVSGGGVLADVGTHVLDLLASWLGPAELVGYADDAMGGVEANALVRLRYGDAPASVRLSRDWDRPNMIELRMEKGWLRWRADEIHAVEIGFGEAGAPLRIVDKGSESADFVACFGAQIDAVLDHLAGRASNVVLASDALPVITLIEQAYRQRQPMDMPWLQPQVRAAHG